MEYVKDFNRLLAFKQKSQDGEKSLPKQEKWSGWRGIKIEETIVYGRWILWRQIPLSISRSMMSSVRLQRKVKLFSFDALSFPEY